MKIAILGTVPDSRIYAPFGEPDWDIWVCSAGNRGGVVPRISAWFELHSVIDLKGQENRSWVPEYFAWLKTQAFPVYMQEPNDLLPQALTFPHRAILKKFGRRGRINLTSSIAWMMAFAILKGATEIGIFGVDMAATEEHYGGQKSGCQNWIVTAEEDYGIKIHIPQESCLSTFPPLYGYAEASVMGRRLVVQEINLKEGIARVQADIGRLTGEMHLMQGALDRTQYFRRTFVDGDADAQLDVADEVSDDAAAYDSQRELIAAAIHPEDTDFASVPTHQVGGVLVPAFASRGLGSIRPNGGLPPGGGAA